MKDVGLWTISKVVLNHSHPCYPDRVEMLKQHNELSMFVRRTIETNEEAGIRPSKTYQSFIAAAESHQELSFIEKDVQSGFWFICGGESPQSVNTSWMRTDEKQGHQSFKWLFECWFRCMGGKPPKGILTDQCASMQRAIELSMPTIIHHWCIWHIMKKIPNKLNDYKRHKKIEQEMSHVVWNSFTKDAFDRNWNDFLTKYDLGGNKWLSELYEDRHIWVPVYLDHHFWAWMRSTQRSERMHAFFNKFITRNSSLSQFMKQYDNCLASREQREREFDAVDFHTVIPCTTKSAIEAQFHHVYTHEKFREVQAQFRGKVNCVTRSKHSTLGFTTYEVME
nr:protein FAR-RED IMPAIRED RESPONSE 1-like [Arachis hypogaea]